MAAAPQKTSHYLVADDRETKVIPAILAIFPPSRYEKGVRATKKPEAETKEKDGTALKQGDFAIFRRGTSRDKLVAVFERKRIEDLAASFKDGRYKHQIDNLVTRRDQTGCQVYLIFEGPAFPSPQRKFHRIPYSQILAAVTKMMIRHGIMVVQTEDELHTARRLLEFVTAMDDEDVFAFPTTEGAEVFDENTGEGKVGGLLCEAIPQSDAELIMTVWTELSGIKAVFGRILSTQFSIAQLARGEISIETLQGLKTEQGRKPNKFAMSSLLAVKKGNTKICEKLLSGIKGVSKNLAKEILTSSGTLSRLCSYSVGTMSLIRRMRGGKESKLGKSLAERIHKMLHFIAEVPGAAIPTVDGANDEEIRNGDGGGNGGDGNGGGGNGGGGDGGGGTEYKANKISSEDISEFM